jgi:hypothetical protein
MAMINLIFSLLIFSLSLSAFSRELSYPLSKYVTSEQLAQIEKDIREGRSQNEVVFVDSTNTDECIKAKNSFIERGWPVSENMCNPKKNAPLVAVQVNKLGISTSITALRCSAKESGQYNLKALMEEYCPYLMFTVIFD